MKCNYCGKSAEWVENKEIYGKNYGKSYMIWWCKDCDAYVGCHNNTKEPLGTLADYTLRGLRKMAKGAFITTFLNGNWKCDRQTKKRAYARLGGLMGLKKDDMHFGKFGIEQCNEVLELTPKSSNTVNRM